MKVLNLYAGIGGNRKLWTDCKVTAVEYNEEIAGIYKEFYPNDTVVVGDAHEYLLNHYKEFDFIWTSPPCQSHSDIRRMGVKIGQNNPVFPDMKLWQEIAFLKGHCDGKFVVENVKPYYECFIKPSIELDRHLFWSNFKITRKEFEKDNRIKHIEGSTVHFGVDLSQRKIKHSKRAILRNMVNPEVGFHIFNCMKKIYINSLTTQQLAMEILYSDCKHDKGYITGLPGGSVCLSCKKVMT